MSIANYTNPTFSEKSFRELLKDMGQHSKHFFGTDRKKLIHAFKNMVYHSYFGRNIFDQSPLYAYGQVTFKRSVLPNPITSGEWIEQYRIKAEYLPILDAVCIPLKPNIERDIIDARIVISAPTYGPVQHAIQIKMSNSRYWGTFYCSPATVRDAIKSLLL
jgi:hypothetical protein